MGILDGLKRGYGKADPFLGRMLGFSKDDAKKFAPRPMHWGGSKKESDAARARYKAGEEAGSKTVAEGRDITRQGVNNALDAASDASSAYQGLRGKAIADSAQYGRQAAEDRGRALGSADDYASGRAGALANAQRMEDLAANAPQNYQQTAQAQFNAQKDANQRAALGVAAGRGAAGLRTALAGSTISNAQAAQQAQITQAQEMNALLGMQQAAYGQAAGIRQSQGAQDLGAAGMFSQREQAGYGNRLGSQSLDAQLTTANYGARANAANQQLGAAGQLMGAGTAERGQYLGAQAAQSTAELNAAREYEGQRQQNEKYNYTQDWFPLKRFNSPGG